MFNELFLSFDGKPRLIDFHVKRLYNVVNLGSKITSKYYHNIRTFLFGSLLIRLKHNYKVSLKMNASVTLPAGKKTKTKT